MAEPLQALQRTLESLVVRMDKLEASRTVKSGQVGQEVMDEDEVDGEDDEVDVPVKTWDTVLKQPVMEAQSAAGRALVCLLSSPPPLDQLRTTIKDAPQFSQVPQTAPPRRKNVDYKLHAVQKTFEQHMNVMVH